MPDSICRPPGVESSPVITVGPVGLIALVGAECTGKSSLCEALAAALPGLWVPEALREFCQRHQRTPRRDEQAALIAEQISRERAALERASMLGLPWVLVDSTPLATALYSVACFDDASLLEPAIAHQRTYRFSLVTDIDVPWQADGIQRDGPGARAAFHLRLTTTLERAAIAHAVLQGDPSARVAQVLRMVGAAV